MIQSGKFADKKILLVDKDEKNINNRTWCFWETQPGLFEPVVHHRWKKLWVHSEDISRLLTIHPYEYKLIQGIDFYQHCQQLIQKQSNFDVMIGAISQMESNEHAAFLKVNGEKISAGYIFNSILFEKPPIKRNEYYLLQHFKGWLIETEQPVFNPDEATLMDFRTGQEHGTAFVYVMPFSPGMALVEYTLFTEDLLQPEEYDLALKNYISGVLKIPAYKIREVEFGIIPMTNYKFPANHGRIINIGTAGGQTKASSGYTFRFIQKHSAAIVQHLANGTSPIIKTGKKRFHFYDSVLLHILQRRTLPGSKIFTTLFSKNKPEPILRFLDNESAVNEELKIISSLPTLPFLKAALRQI
jgi:lycopene beta-cyclase